MKEVLLEIMEQVGLRFSILSLLCLILVILITAYLYPKVFTENSKTCESNLASHTPDTAPKTIKTNFTP